MDTSKPTKKIKGKDFYALICDEWSTFRIKKDKVSLLLCGVYSTRKEAVDVAKEIKDCPCKHIVKKCSVEVTCV